MLNKIEGYCIFIFKRILLTIKLYRHDLSLHLMLSFIYCQYDYTRNIYDIISRI